MGFLGGIFGQKSEPKEEKQLPWKLLEKMEQLDEIEALSNEKLVVIFKHSTRCGTSRMAYHGFQRDFDTDMEGVEVYVLDILAHRAISDEVAARFQVWHESPQLVLIKNGAVVHHSSHYQISAAVLQDFV